MQVSTWSGPLKMAAYAVVVLMAAAILYAAWIALRYWPGIGV